MQIESRLNNLLERSGRSMFLSLLQTLKPTKQDWSQRHIFCNLPPAHRSPSQFVFHYIVFGYFLGLLWCSNMNFPHLMSHKRLSQPFSRLQETRMNCGHPIFFFFFLCPTPCVHSNERGLTCSFVHQQFELLVTLYFKGSHMPTESYNYQPCWRYKNNILNIKRCFLKW